MTAREAREGGSKGQLLGLEAFVAELGPQGPQLLETEAGSRVSQQLRCCVF